MLYATPARHPSSLSRQICAVEPFEVLPHLGSGLQVCDQHFWPFVKFNTTEQTNEEVKRYSCYRLLAIATVCSLMNGFLDERKCEWRGKVKFDLRESTD